MLVRIGLVIVILAAIVLAVSLVAALVLLLGTGLARLFPVSIGEASLAVMGSVLAVIWMLNSFINLAMPGLRGDRPDEDDEDDEDDLVDEEDEDDSLPSRRGATIVLTNVPPLPRPPTRPGRRRR